MIWSSFWEWLGATVTLSTVAVAITSAIAFASRNVFIYALSTRLESVKAEYQRELEGMRQEHETDLEHFRSELAVLQDKSVIQYSRLHEEQARTIKEIYDCAVDAAVATREYLLAVRDALNAGSTTDTSAESRSFHEKLNRLNGRFINGRIYFDSDLDQLLMDVIKSTKADVESFEELAERKSNAVFAQSIGVFAMTVNPKLTPANVGQIDLDAELVSVYDKLGALQERLVEYFRKTLGSIQG